MKPSETSHYVHGSESDEQSRLSTLNSLINSSSLRELHLRGGEMVLDVGSGLGQLTRAMAKTVGRVIGIERDPSQIAECRRLAVLDGEEKTIDIRQGDVSAFPLHDNEWGMFDVTHSRFLLEHVPDPQIVVDQMVKAARPGGRIVLEDDDHDLLRLWPEPEGVYAVWDAYCRSYTARGNDPLIGRKLGSLLHRAGATLIRSTWIYFGACAGEKEFPLYVDNLSSILEGARTHMVQSKLATDEMIARGVASLRLWKNRPDAVFWYARAWVEGRKEGGNAKTRKAKRGR